MIGKTGFQYNNPIKDISESMPIPHQTLDHLRTTQNDPADPIDPILTRNTPANLAESDGSLDLSFGQKLYSNSILGLHGSLSNSRNASPLNKMTMENHTADFNISLNSTKRTSSVDTQSSIWATMETLTITSPLDSHDVRSGNAPPQFSDKFLDDDEDINAFPTALKYTSESSNLPRLIRQSSSQSTVISTSHLDLASIPQTSPRRASTGGWSGFTVPTPIPSDYSGSSLENHSSLPITSIPNLRKSMSLASLDKPDASFDHSDSYSLHSYPHESSDNSYHPKLRSRNSEPNIYMQNIIESNNSYGICRYFLQGYCSRGDRCHFAHVTNLPQVQQRSQFNVPYNSHPNINPNKHAHSTSSSPQFFPGPSAVGVPTPKLGASKVKKTPEEEVNRFLSVEVKDLVGQIYYFCKDQYGCRYLQKQIEEHEKDVISIIFNDIFQNFAELMIDPFGNYLCQKLIEYCTEEQRGEIVQQVSTNLIEISLNIHGTRAVQKLIEFVNVHDQTETIINALNVDPVSLIKDLNGNHVIQKCLSKLSHIDNQFVFDAVSRNCMQVATHRHGCCVLQRCIDHATDIQRSQLVNEIARHALALVQDPFGNYVVQYVLDLGEIKYSECIVKPFIGNVCLLSVQKFSSNVIEKCIRVSGQKLRASLINELLDQDRLEKLLCDSFANYVVQTALDYAAPDQRVKLIDCIRPILPVIRNTPYGKRIQSKFLRDGVPNYTQLAYNTGLTVTKPFL